MRGIIRQSLIKFWLYEKLTARQKNLKRGRGQLNDSLRQAAIAECHANGISTHTADRALEEVRKEGKARGVNAKGLSS